MGSSFLQCLLSAPGGKLNTSLHKVILSCHFILIKHVICNGRGVDGICHIVTYFSVSLNITMNPSISSSKNHKCYHDITTSLPT